MRELYYNNKLKVLLFLVILTLVIHEIFHGINFKLLAETILFTLIAFVFFDWVANVTTKKELFDNIFKMLKNYHENIEMGFERVVLNAETIEYKKLISKSKEIFICQIYGRQWLENNKRAFIERISNDSNVKITFLIYSDDNNSIESLSTLFTDNDINKLKGKINEAIDICKEIQKIKPLQVEIKTIDKRPLFGAIYLFDDVAFHIPLSTSKSTYSDFMAYEFENTNQEKNGYKILKKQIDELLK